MNTERSGRFSLNEYDFKKIATGASIAMAGAALTYMLELSNKIDFGIYTPMVTAFMSILVNGVKKYIERDTMIQ